jgi:hypothetical protein
MMKRANVPFPLFALFGLTRGMAGIGVGMLLADHLKKRRRRRLAKILLGIGATSTLPLLIAFFRANRKRDVGGVMEPMTEVYQPEMGTVDDAEIESPLQQAETPNIVPQ